MADLGAWLARHLSGSRPAGHREAVPGPTAAEAGTGGRCQAITDPGDPAYWLIAVIAASVTGDGHWTGPGPFRVTWLPGTGEP